MNKIDIKSIGVIHSPYNDLKDIPIQGKLNDKVEGWVELDDKYCDGLYDLEKFSHAILIYYFHKSNRTDIKAKPFLENKIHGIFAIRSPNRPNHIGMTIVKIKRIENNKLYFTHVDMINETPLLDIKPYVEYFDSQKNTISGWIEKHCKKN
jgi:tRNA-Thr(GGU) m(6)t(6)A37 methyltransferase TsaA